MGDAQTHMALGGRPEDDEPVEDLGAEHDGAAMAVYRQIARNAADKTRYGKALSREELKAVREVAILDSEETHWRDRHHAAEAFGISPKTFERWAAEMRAAGVELEPHAPIPKERVYRWRIAVLEQTGGVASTDTDRKTQRLDEEIRKLRITNDHNEGAYLAEAEATAAEALAGVARALKAGLQWELPGDLVADLGLTEPGIESRIRRAIKRTLTELAQASGQLEDLIVEPPGPADQVDPIPETTEIPS